MPRFEYKVVPAPQKGLKAKGVKGAEARFSHALQELMNGLAGYGWEYQRAETLPSIERAGLTSTTTEWRNVLVFRRLRETDTEAFAPELLPPPSDAAAREAEVAQKETPPADADAGGETAKDAQNDAAESEKTDTAEKTSAWDNGVEDTKDVEGIGSTLETLAASRKTSKTDG
ncbi:hypothetical protein [Sulfitobacter geojensis]|uniref:hypothetical protein n=1 Tax=Sulfitobacter geojensis TaxID=1342299 RepID=UPI00046A6160|nr:hypothetical protein [Sulfitobacter geojensis]KHA52797.1 hypothetical protein Z947_3107 [Sulfitobacter geojensis]NYI28537.1 hypothetical protein [Sulfitobacter geojensis]